MPRHVTRRLQYIRLLPPVYECCGGYEHTAACLRNRALKRWGLILLGSSMLGLIIAILFDIL